MKNESVIDSQWFANQAKKCRMLAKGLDQRTAKTLNLSSVRLPSGAGHDAQMMAQLAPMGMIFVPSIGGISHSPKELTSWRDCSNGANVLLHAVLTLDRL